MGWNKPKKTGANFWNFVDQQPQGCWDWKGVLNTGGYGRLSVDGVMVQAHRYAYELTYGPIMSGRVIWHTCGNPRCVRPDHLEAITGNEQSLRNIRANTATKFWAYVEKTTDGCWEWQGRLNSNGYGRIHIGGKHVLTHRYSYTLVHGSIPDGLVLDHLCSNPKCVRPDHLEAVTQTINVQRGRNYWRKRTHCKNGHEYTPENTYRYGNARHCRQCIYDRINRRRQRKRMEQLRSDPAAD